MKRVKKELLFFSLLLSIVILLLCVLFVSCPPPSDGEKEEPEPPPEPGTLIISVNETDASTDGKRFLFLIQKAGESTQWFDDLGGGEATLDAAPKSIVARNDLDEIITFNGGQVLDIHMVVDVDGDWNANLGPEEWVDRYGIKTGITIDGDTTVNIMNADLPVAGSGIKVFAYVINNPGLGAFAMVQIMNNGIAIPDVDTVMVDSTDLIYDAGSEMYSANLGPFLVWSDIQLIISNNTPAININRTLALNAEPLVNQPNTAGSDYDADATIDVEWNDFNPDPEGFNIMIDSSFTNSGNDYTEFEDGSSTTFPIPGGTIADGTTDVVVDVISVEAVDLSINGYAMGSLYGVGNTGHSEPFDTDNP